MTQPPAGWHPDPTGRFEHRYWNGLAWTEHVSRQGRAGVDPLDAAPGSDAASGAVPSEQSEPRQVEQSEPRQSEPRQSEPVPSGPQPGPHQEEPRPGPVQDEQPHRTVYVDASVRLGLTGYTRLFADEHAVWNGDRSISYADVTAVNYGITRMQGSPVFRYEVRLFTGKKQHLVKFEGRDEQSRQVYDLLVRAVFEQVCSRLLAEAVARTDAGEEVELGGWIFSREGARQGRKSLTWGTPVTLRNSTTSNVASVYVIAEQDGRSKTIGQYDFLGQNGCLVPVMLDLCRERYTS